MRAAAIFIVTASLLTNPKQALAEPPPGADLNSTISKWYQSLKDKQGNGCCNLADCRPVSVRMSAAGWEVFVDKQSFGATAPDDWVGVPEQALVVREDNPTGRNIACYSYSKLRCMTPFGGI